MKSALWFGGLVLSAAGFAGPPQADAERGRIAFQKCYACHHLAADNDVAGPSLHGIIDGPIAGRPGYDYSPALRALAQREGRWSEALLDRFIADPEAVAPGTAMTFTGMRDAQERADLLTWLRQPDARLDSARRGE